MCAKFTTSVMEVRTMKDLMAKKPSEPAICLKLLYLNSIPYSERLKEINGKIVYLVEMDADEDIERQLAEAYRVMIS